MNPERRSSGSQFYIVWGDVYSEGQLGQFSKQLRMQKVQDAFNKLAAEHRAEIMQMRRDRNREGLQELQDKLAAEAESKVGKSGLTDEQLKIYSTVGGTPHLDGQYTVFGEVEEGLDVVEMEYRKIGDNYYIRMDRGDEIICNLLEICEKESIPSAVFSGIGGCQSAELQVFIPETGSFETEQLEGMLELVSLNGNVVRDDDGKLFHHTHALFSFKKDGQHGELRPTVGGAIGRKFDPETGTGFWNFKD